ncbi:MAG: hypothetical protein IJ640_00095 [Prevotella sp.]|nr:hypothetical protein [Prevotella sp.]
MTNPIYRGIGDNGLPVFTHQKYNYASCDIQFKDGTCKEDIIIKLNQYYEEEEDEQIFFYAEDYESFLSLCTDEFKEDFRVLTIHKLYEAL